MSNDYLVGPYDITRFDRTQDEMELMIVFCICVAGKKASTMAKMVQSFFLNSHETGSPFEQIRKLQDKGKLVTHLREAKIGRYNILVRGLYQLATSNLDLYTCTPEDLEKITGIGMKTSRFFILHSRKDSHIAVIDTHILKYLRSIGVENVPDSTPTGKEYKRLEKIILDEAKRLHMTPHEFDLKAWTWYSNRNNGDFAGN